jgi:hypothetical protein
LGIFHSIHNDKYCFLLLSILCIAANLSSEGTTGTTYTTVYGKYRHYINNRHNFHFVCYFVKYLVYKVISIKDWCKTYAVPMSSRAWKRVCTLTMYLLPNNIKLFGFPTFRLWAYLMKFIPETHRVHYILNISWI